MRNKNLIPLINDILSESVLTPEVKFLNFSPKEIAKFNNSDSITIIRKKEAVSDLYFGDYVKPEWNKIYLVTAMNQYADITECPSFSMLTENEIGEFLDQNGEDVPVYEIKLEHLIKKEIQRFFYDCEFDESNEKEIKLISIGIISEDGRELYLINKDYDWSTSSQWLIDNVKPYIISAPDYCKVSYCEIKNYIMNFIKPSALINTKLYGYYSAYDHVVLSQIFGRMIDLPEGMPMYTIDLKQYLDYFDINKDVLMANIQLDEHDAILDARWNLKLYNAITKLMGVEL